MCSVPMRGSSAAACSASSAVSLLSSYVSSVVRVESANSRSGSRSCHSRTRAAWNRPRTRQGRKPSGDHPPRTRGAGGDRRRLEVGLGTIPAGAGSSSSSTGFAGPGRAISPCAGMVSPSSRSGAPRRTAPLTRGDGPDQHYQLTKVFGCSPHARGWPQGHPGVGAGRGLLPARSGMVPGSGTWPSSGGSAPRPRGDGPLLA